MGKRLKQIVSIIFLALLFLWLVVISFPVGGETKVMNHKDPAKAYEPVFRDEGDLTIYTAEDSLIVSLDIELAENQQEISYGMMYRKSIPEKSGMLFLMPTEEPQSFWMKNTYVSLDIIYFNSKNEIVSIQKNTEPLSETLLPSHEPTAIVLEVEGGFSDKYGLKKGDKIKYSRN